MPTILIIDDEEAIAYAFCRFLEKRGYATLRAFNSREALAHASRADVAFLDVRLGAEDGLALLPQLLATNPALRIIVMTAFGTLETVSRAMEGQAFDYVTKPLDLQDALHLVEQALASVQQTPQTAVPAASGFVGDSPVMQSLFKQLLRVAAVEAPVLITGETGTGKELAARLLHQKSARANGPFVAVNCGALPEHLVESELFGHCKGAFTGALQDKTGFCETANHGILFLDEIGELPLPVQVKLLRFLDNPTFEKIGGTTPIHVDVRIIAATNRDLHAAVAQGSFRADLFYRLDVLHIQTPPLRQHPDDIPALAQHFLHEVAPHTHFSPEALAALQKHPWPGNVRELRNTIWQAATLAAGSLLQPNQIPFAPASEKNASPSLQAFVDSLSDDSLAMEPLLQALQKLLAQRALALTNGNQTAAAELLGIHRNSLHRIL
ncbi:MAG: sigma-54-dependent Fis family transcriptional regulator [Victivallales bacterium]|nr:sigma-54-dependent Fis family transcriptional regulator [Victivallales bacterium]